MPLARRRSSRRQAKAGNTEFCQIALFTPIQLRGLTLRNRIVISPLCQYSAVEGTAQPWHWMHIGHFAISGAGLVIMEATGVSAVGRISPQCLGLYSDENEAALTQADCRICAAFSDMPIGIQLDHAGRKASTRPDLGIVERARRVARGGRLAAGGAFGGSVYDRDGRFPSNWMRRDWRACGRSLSIRRGERRAADSTWIEIHAAHGYLLHEFMSPLTNHRSDAYGGTAQKRMRFPLEVAEAMRAVWPAEKPLGMRITGEDWVPGGLTLEDAVQFAGSAERDGDRLCDAFGRKYCSRDEVPAVGPGYLVPFAERIKRETGITTMTVGMIVEPDQANEIIAVGEGRHGGDRSGHHGRSTLALARSSEAWREGPRWLRNTRDARPSTGRHIRWCMEWRCAKARA